MTDQFPPDCPYRIGFLAETFPPLSPAEHAVLVVRISRHGYRPAVIIWRDEIVFGVELLTAYAEAGREPRFEYLPEEADPVEGVAAEAIPSLEMNNNARAVVAALASLWSTPGRPRDEDKNSANLQNKTRTAMAERFAVSVRGVNYAAQVLSEESPAVPALRQAVRGWKINATDAANVLKKPPEVQQRAVELVMEGKVKTVRRAAKQVERESAEAEEQAALAEILARPLDETVTLHVASAADMLQLAPRGSVDAIITHPSHSPEKLGMYSDLAEFAAHALKPTGCLIVVGQGILLPRMMEALTHPELVWRCEGDLLFHGRPMGSGPPHHVRLHRRPVLVYGKKAFGLDPVDDLFEVAAPEELPLGLDRNEKAMELILERFCRPGQTVCDPIMLDRAGVALAARKIGCRFIGATGEESSRDRIHARLVTSEDQRDDAAGAGGSEAD